MTDSTEPKFSPDAEHSYFLAEPQEPLMYFATAAERDEYAKRLIEKYRCDTWDPDVDNIVAGVVTHKATKHNFTYPVGDVEDDGYDQNSQGPFEEQDSYLCDYELQPIPCGVSATELTPEQIARVAHEVNRAYCQALGDHSQPPWEQAAQWQQDSAMLGVRLHTETPNAGPQIGHEWWAEQKVADGWTYGPEKIPELKQHPCLVPFDQLPQEQQAKDFIFRGVVHALTAKSLKSSC